MSMTTDNKSTFLIKSSKNSSFGTGFVVYKSENISYLVTCAHVVGACDKDALMVDNKEATLVAIGAKEFIDLAVISVENLESVALKISDIDVYEQMPFNVKGFKKHINQNHKFELLDGTIKKHSQIATAQKNIDIYELSLCLDDNIEKGYSGSAIYSVSSAYVFAVAISRYDKTHADAIPIKYLKEIWAEIPDGLFIEESVLDDEDLAKESLKKLLKDINYDVVDFQKLAYGVLPNVNKVLPQAIDEVIDELFIVEDIDNKLNVPILCLVKKLYAKTGNNDFFDWLKSTESRYVELTNKSLDCKENILDVSHNILIEISVKNKDIKNSTISIWEDQVLIEGKTNYVPVFNEDIDLESSDEIKSFLDSLYVYLQKFSPWDHILLEFILPEVLLTQEIKLWENSEEYRLPEDFRLVYRLQERFTNYLKYDKFWKSKWDENHNNRTQKLSTNSLTLNTDKEIRAINSRVAGAVITKFSICDTDIFKRIYKYGIPLVISPNASMNADELVQFNQWFEDEFQDTKIENLIEEVQMLFTDYTDELKSKIILIWDDPNKLPLTVKNPEHNQYTM